MKSTEVAEELRAFEGNIRPPTGHRLGMQGNANMYPTTR